MDLAIDRKPAGWTLTDARPGPLALRLTAAALAVGAAGGVVTATLSVLFGATETTPTARILAIGLPFILFALIAWRLAAPTTASGRWLTGATVAGVTLTAVAQGWTEMGGLDVDLIGSAALIFFVALYGAAFGLAPAVLVLAVVVPALLLLRTTRVRVTLPSAQLLLTTFAMAVTAVFALWITTEMNTAIITGLAAALAGAGAVRTARWAMAGRRP
ncbi:hypothetical protein [Actinoplanes sp. NPDC051494]|uniref:hypothetical protein n=1 Tax=Actinoplanes sp. NPDC051494 TaxID=3363907 RepID=UPI0037AFCA7D